MKRDLNLIREILRTCECHECGYAPKKLTIEGYTDEQIGFHVYLAGEAGLLIVAEKSTPGSTSPEATALNITWQGYEFLETSRSEIHWNRVTDAAKSAGGMSLDVLRSILVQATAMAVRERLGF